MTKPILKAFILCEDITNKPESRDQMHLQGAGLARFECVDPFPVKRSFWAFIQLADDKATGQARLALTRADSDRRYLFGSVTVRHKNAVQATAFCVRLYDLVFPDKGVYFVELWYNGRWLVDQRLELM